MKCKHCGQVITDELKAQKAKQKSDRIKQARKEAKARGEQVGALKRYDYGQMRKYREAGFTIRRIAEIMGCSTSPVVSAIKNPELNN